MLFACVHNAGRSQMAAAFFAKLANPKRAEVISAGTRPGERVHMEVVEIMREVGVDLSSARPQRLTQRAIRDEIKNRVIELLKREGWSRT